jgi:hypothetical protein
MMRRRIALFLLVFLAAGGLFAAEEKYEKAFSLEGVREVSVQNINGAVEVRSWNRPYVRVTAVKTASRRDTLRRTEIRVRQVGDVIKIETISPRRRHLFFFFDFGDKVARIHYEILMPASTECRAETVNGPVDVASITAPVRAETVNGRVSISGAASSVRAETVNGSIELSFGSALRATDLHTVNGAIDVTFPRSSSVGFRLQTVNGGISAENMDLTVTGKFGPKEGRGSFNGGGETLSAETVNGSIRLHAE